MNTPSHLGFHTRSSWFGLSALALLAATATVACYSTDPVSEEEALGQTEEAFSGTRATVLTQYGTWKGYYVKDVTHCGSVTPCKRVARLDEGNDTVSEGIGYGMLLAAYLDDRTTFDGLWNYYRTHLNSNGLMNWKWDANNSMTGANEATDAAEDAAIALIVADKKGWGTPAGDNQTYNFRAKDLIARILQYMVTTNNDVKPGDANWNVWDITYNPSYLTAPYATVFSTYTGVTRWDSVKTRDYAQLANLDNNDAGARTTGLVPDWMCRDGGQTSCSLATNIEWDRTNGGGAGSRVWWFSYDACRTPWRLAMDWAWHGNTTAGARLDKINAWASPKAGNIVNGYALDGTEPPTSQYPAGTKAVLGAFVGPIAAASVKGSQTYQDTMWTKLIGLGQGSNYFSDTVRILSLAFMSGSMPNPLTVGSSCTPTTCGTAVCGSKSDGCGGTLSCGTCASGQTCNSSNQCVASCSPATCSSLGKNCGSVSDGCGGTLSCGTCGSGETCSANVCTTTASCSGSSGSGTISWEKWANQGSGTSILASPTGTPTTGTFTSFEAPTNSGDAYQLRLRGTLTAPCTGSYTFWIAGDDNSELWLSTTSSESNKAKIASVTGWTNSREWNKYASQKSAAISLTGGQKYYIEAILKEGSGGDNLAVGWAKPGDSTTVANSAAIVIPGSALSPYSASCTPATCSSLGATCGSPSNGCGGTLSCGTCGSGLTCNSSNQCVSSCVPTTCGTAVCGSKSDGCGNTLSCGTCGSGLTCNSSNQCVSSCVPTTCGTAVCGSKSDGCGNTLNCGTCGSGLTCNSSNQCVTGSSGTEPCTPNATFGAGVTNSGSFNTTGAYCFRTSMDVAGWGCSNFDGRTLQVNDVAKSVGSMPLPTKYNGYYYFESTGGVYSYASCYWW